MSLTTNNYKNVQIYPLLSILNGDPNTIEKFSDSIKKCGFAFVTLPSNLVQKIDKCVTIIEDFFLQNINYKKHFFKKPIFGYFNANHKESIRFLTGIRLEEHIIPENFIPIINLIKLIDNIMFKLCMKSKKYLFPNIIEQAKIKKIPLFYSENYWGMFDFTKYNNLEQRRNGLNCNPHYDPGLLSIHLRSTQPGLQLKDENNKWIIPPNDKNIAIIWAGDIATKINPKIKHGVHRVVTNNSNSKIPRIALWHEICTEMQEHTELMHTKTIDLAKKEYSTGIPLSKSA
jgi:isopenicillin N synthase-like dioxygenase